MWTLAISSSRGVAVCPLWRESTVRRLSLRLATTRRTGDSRSVTGAVVLRHAQRQKGVTGEHRRRDRDEGHRVLRASPGPGHAVRAGDVGAVLLLRHAGHPHDLP